MSLSASGGEVERDYIAFDFDPSDTTAKEVEYEADEDREIVEVFMDVNPDAFSDGDLAGSIQMHLGSSQGRSANSVSKDHNRVLNPSFRYNQDETNGLAHNEGLGVLDWEPTEPLTWKEGQTLHFRVGSSQNNPGFAVNIIVFYRKL